MTKKELVLLVMFLSLAHFVVNMYALTHLWSWFIVPLGVKPIGMLQAAGLTTIVTFYKDPAQKKDKSTTEQLAELIGLDLGALLLGYLIHLFM